jgi:formate dehydrogenase major subunit
MAEIAALTPSFHGVSYERLDQEGSIQWPCNEAAPHGTPVMHVEGFTRGKGLFVVTEYVATDREGHAALPAVADHRAHPVAVQRRRPDPAHRQHAWHHEDVLEIHPHDAEERGIRR